jgi:hypothetical protein
MKQQCYIAHGLTRAYVVRRPLAGFLTGSVVFKLEV